MRRNEGRAHLHADIEELNLTPILNLVVILIPLLLLSVVFEQMGVIDLRTPKLVGADDHQEIIHTPRLGLMLTITPRGFVLTSAGEALMPAPGPECGAGPEQLCNRRGQDASALLAEVDALRAQHDRTGARELLTRSDARLVEALDLYDMRGLYNTLVTLKRQHPDEETLTVSADPNIPFELLVATMDMARFRLAGGGPDGRFERDDAFQKAPYASDAQGHTPLFRDVTLAVVH